MATLPIQFPKYTAEDYAGWKGDWELWDGVPIAMSPSPFGRHQTVLSRVVTQLTNAVDQSQCNATVVAELDWIVRQDTVVRPDVMVICGPPPETHQRETPSLIVEVLSSSTQANDKGFKRALYSERNVDFYLIIDPIVETVEMIQRGGSSEEFIRVTGVIDVVLCEDCKITLETDRFFPKRSAP